VSSKSNKKAPADVNLKEGDIALKDKTCFSLYKESNTPCNSTECRYWQDMKGKHQDCIINAAAEGPFTLQEVGDIFSVTRMRICQIEKAAKQILKCSFADDQL